MSKPHRCPHIATTGAVCVYCPGGPDSDFEYSTQSYTGAAFETLFCCSLVARRSHQRCKCLQAGQPDGRSHVMRQSMGYELQNCCNATGYEPTSMRAIRARYNPYVQARGRVDQLRKLGHSVDKVCYLLMLTAAGWSTCPQQGSNKSCTRSDTNHHAWVCNLA